VKAQPRSAPLAPIPSFVEQLKGKSRRRRQDLAGLAEVEAARRPRRNDLLPRRELAHVSLDLLKTSAREVRKLQPAHVQQVANAIAALGFCAPILIGRDSLVLDGAARVEAARSLGLERVPCVRIEHLSDDEQRVLRLAINRLGETGSWNLEALKIEFEELILADAPIEISGFSLDEIDQIVLGDGVDGFEKGPLEPDPSATPISKVGDIFQLGPHRIACGDATNPEILHRLMGEGEMARLVLTDEPYNVPIVGNVTKGQHREFAMASGEMSEDQFLAFNEAWMTAALPHLQDGGVLATFIDWRGYPTANAAALKLGLAPLNLIVWRKTNAGMGSLYRSQHELLPLSKRGTASHVNNVELGKRGRWRSNVWTYPGASSLGSDVAWAQRSSDC
jgi:DNA methylase/ParB-like nuclease domain